jgi:peroxiredoxin
MATRGLRYFFLAAGTVAASACGDADSVKGTKTPTPTATSTATGGKPSGTTPPSQQPAMLEPGEYSSPLVQLQRLQGQVGHLHVDEIRYRESDKRLFQCSYTFGVIDARDPSKMRYLAENLKHKIGDDTRTPGCIHLAWDGDVVYTTHRGNLSNPTFVTGWDISAVDPDKGTIKPVQLPALQEPGESYEGIDVEDGVVYVALRDHGLGVYERDTTTNTLSRIGTVSGLGSTWGLRVRDAKVYTTDIEGGLSIVDVGDPKNPTLLGRVDIDGVAKGLTLDGDLAYVAAGDAGLVVVDISNSEEPKIVGRAKTRGPAIRTAYSDGYVFVAAWNDTRVYDVSKPSAPRFVGAVRLTTDVQYPDDGHPAVTARTMGVAATGRSIFVGNWWVQYSFRLYPERIAPNMVLPEDVNLMDFGPAGVGETNTLSLSVTNQGTAPLTLFHNWTDNPAFKVTPEELKVMPGNSGKLKVEYTASSGDKETGTLNIWSDDPLQPVRSAFLAGNQPGLGIGKPLPETRATLLDGSDWSSTNVQDKVMLLGYFATFCPVCSVEVRDYEDRFKKKYGDKVEIVLLNANGDPVDGVQEYVRNLHITYNIGLEDPATKTFAALNEVFKGANPFPDDIVVGKDGKIAYISREYDPDEIERAIDAELARDVSK